MTWISRAAGLHGLVFAAFALAATATATVACDFPACAGMALVEGGSPKVDSPDSNPGTTPDDGQRGREPETHGNSDNDNGDKGAGSDRASPPDFVQPPGCIFREGPLDLIV